MGASAETEWPIVFQQPTVQRSATVVASALMLLVHRISKAMPGGPALDSMARPLRCGGVAAGKWQGASLSLAK